MDWEMLRVVAIVAALGIPAGVSVVLALRGRDLIAELQQRLGE